MTDPTDTPTPVEPRHRKWVIEHRFQPTRGDVVLESCAEAYAWGEQEGRRLADEIKAAILTRYPNGCPWCEASGDWLDGLTCRECGGNPYEQEILSAQGARDAILDDGRRLEREAVVRWLRTLGDRADSHGIDMRFSAEYQDEADAIERGDHLQESDDAK